MLDNREISMAQYFMSYIGGNQPSSPEEGQKHFAQYQEWLASLGESLVSPANPLKGTSVVSPGGEVSVGGVTGMSGYSIVQAESIEAALEMAKACPFLDIGGSLEVSELVQMPSAK